MPAIVTDTTKHQGYHLHIDWQLILVLLIVAGIVLLQIVLALGYIRLQNLRSKARWRRLRERGVVFVEGPALIWIDDLPPRATFSTFDLRKTLQASRGRG